MFSHDCTPDTPLYTKLPHFFQLLALLTSLTRASALLIPTLHSSVSDLFTIGNCTSDFAVLCPLLCPLLSSHATPCLAFVTSPFLSFKKTVPYTIHLDLYFSLPLKIYVLFIITRQEKAFESRKSVLL